mmetsp:Transcript_76376/g.151062  ORF Transcript_76376/g.151062 Transcript_76376/m.151062 type:complete len:305 (+) Transcript_76376:60-974(+)
MPPLLVRVRRGRWPTTQAAALVLVATVASIGQCLVISGSQGADADLWRPLDVPPHAGDGSGAVVARLLEFLVPLHLRRYQSVRAAVRSQTNTLVQGRVQAVHLQGLDWHSRADLTARRLIVTAPDGAALNYLEALAGQLTLTAPTTGWAEAVFDARDFGNFLKYQPVATTVPRIAGERFLFSSEGVVVDTAARHIVFSGRWGRRPVKAMLEAGPAPGMALSVCILEAGSSVADASMLGSALTHFFRNLRVDLCGVELSFAAMDVRPWHPSATKRAGSRDGVVPAVWLRLRATIQRIPNPARDRI